MCITLPADKSKELFAACLTEFTITPLPAEELYELYHLMIKLIKGGGEARLRSVLKLRGLILS